MDPDLIPICDTCDAIERDCPTCGAEPGQCCSSPDPTDDRLGIEHGRHIHRSRE
jgi:hypothetical protein